MVFTLETCSNLLVFHLIDEKNFHFYCFIEETILRCANLNVYVSIGFKFAISYSLPGGQTLVSAFFQFTLT